ncbi:MAG: hypothetical protein ACP5TY_09720 [Thermodesulforhabdaceae bacterium]
MSSIADVLRKDFGGEAITFIMERWLTELRGRHFSFRHCEAAISHSVIARLTKSAVAILPKPSLRGCEAAVAISL